MVARLSIIVSGQSVTYGEVLHNILIGNITNYDDSFGEVVYYSQQQFSASANISMTSLTNTKVLEGTIQLYEYATFGEKWGDTVFFNLFMRYNGQAYNYLEFKDLKTDLVELARGNDTLLKIWEETSTDADLANLYRSLQQHD